MMEDLISVIDVAENLGKRKQTIFKVLKRLGIETKKQRNPSRKNQLVSYITQNEYKRVSSELLSKASWNEAGSGDIADEDNFVSPEIGVFYLVQLEPDHDPGRLKVGFTANMAERLRALKCSAPFASVVKTWPCRRLWEKTAIDCVTSKSDQLHTEVFRTDSLKEVLRKCEDFFGLMPTEDVTDGSNRSMNREQGPE